MQQMPGRDAYLDGLLANQCAAVPKAFTLRGRFERIE